MASDEHTVKLGNLSWRLIALCERRTASMMIPPAKASAVVCCPPAAASMPNSEVCQSEKCPFARHAQDGDGQERYQDAHGSWPTTLNFVADLPQLTAVVLLSFQWGKALMLLCAMEEARGPLPCFCALMWRPEIILRLSRLGQCQC